MTTLNTHQSISMKQKVKQELFKHSWWVFLFLAMNLVGFNMAYKQALSKIASLHSTYLNLEQARNNLEQRQNHLSFQIKSLEDQKTVEMILKKELGLVSERQTKVYFATP